MVNQRFPFFGFLSLIVLVSTGCAPHDDPPRQDRVQEETLEVPPPAVVTPTALKTRIDAALEHVQQRDLLTTHGFWTVFHGLLGMGPYETTLFDPATKQRRKAIDYVCEGAPIRGMVFLPMGAAGVDVQTQPGTGVGQGHQDQFVAEMCQWGLPLDTKFTVAGKAHTFEDFVRYSKARASVTTNQELSWAIVIIGQHYGTDFAWTNMAGEKLTFEDIVRYEVNQPIESAACGGTHRLFGLTWAYHLHLQKGGKTTGVWQDVANKIDHYKKEAHRLQNPDGAFSTGYVSQPGNDATVGARIATTGHVLEWLSLALSDKELAEPWVQEAAYALVQMILESRSDPIEGGALYHAVHGLHIYRARMFGTPTRGLLFPLLK
jgi:hypothetical protein